MIAALYVAKGGTYYNIPDVDPWDESRDARLYDGPWAVVAHPPCQRWGRYWSGGPSAKVRRDKGDDGGCFAAALDAVRMWGGVLEHPEASHAWRAFGLLAPPKDGGWVTAGDWQGWTCCVEQGHYGHRARKATWLYAAHVELPVLRWGPSAATVRLDAGFHSAAERRAMMRPPKGMPSEWCAAHTRRATRAGASSGKELLTPERINKRERAATPIPFRDVLLSIARSAQPQRQAG